MPKIVRVNDFAFPPRLVSTLETLKVVLRSLREATVTCLAVLTVLSKVRRTLEPMSLELMWSVCRRQAVLVIPVSTVVFVCYFLTLWRMGEAQSVEVGCCYFV